MSEQKSIDSWDGLLINYLKAENLQSEEDVYVCIGLERDGEELKLLLEFKEKNWVFSMNKTNMTFLKSESKMEAPRDVIGKKITFKKTMAMNPQIKKEVPALRIIKVE